MSTQQYGAPMNQYGGPDHSQPAGISTASVVLGAVGFVVGICSIIGLILGLVARGKANRGEISQARIKAGIIVSSISLGLNIIGGIIGFAVLGAGLSSIDDTSRALASASASAEASALADAPADAPVAADPAPADVPAVENPSPAAAEVPAGTVSQQNAVRAAKSYLEYTSFSHQSLVDQLTFEGYTTEQAEYGVSLTGL